MAKVLRIGLSDKIRFQVFKRDSFTCQYCGKKAPDVVLNADHIHPVSKGGTNDLLNLLTSCAACNGGKSDHLLSDDAAVQKSRNQAQAMEERNAQIRMMAEWQVELCQMDPEMDAIDAVLKRVNNSHLTESGKSEYRGYVRKFGLVEVMQSLAIAFDSYPPDIAMSKVKGILFCRKMEAEDPALSATMRALRAIASKMGYHQVHYGVVAGILKNWHKDGRDTLAILRGVEGTVRTLYQLRCALQSVNDQLA